MKPVEVNLILETGGGGAGRHVLDLYTGLSRRGWPARLVISMERADNQFFDEIQALDPSHIIYLPLRRSPHYSDLSALAKLTSYFRHSGKKHLLHAHSTKAGMLGALMKRFVEGIILTPHAYRGMDPTLREPNLTAIRFMESMYSKPYEKVIAVSPPEYDYAIGLGISPERVVYVPNGIDLQAWARPRQAATSEPSIPVIGFVGRLVDQKNPLLFLEVLKQIRSRGHDFRAIIVGDGFLRGQLEIQAEKWNLSGLIDWRGFASGSDAIREMDVAVHTSKYESLPYTLLEAVAAGVPIVAVANSGSRTILDGVHHNALHEDPSATTLANAVIDVMHPGKSRDAFLQSLVVAANTFDIDSMLAATIAIYEEQLGRRSS
jgi:glycosyltransferase involved in cell wall biosynthesis